MPRLHHRKARTGCRRCKARKVKCDEGKPRCSACVRHDVSCEYVNNASQRSSSTFSTPPPTTNANGPDDGLSDGLHAKLEVRLMHEWTAYTCQTFSTAWEFWRFRAPLIALERRYVLDAMFALSALNASRRLPNQPPPVDSYILSPGQELPEPVSDLSDWSLPRPDSRPGTPADIHAKLRLSMVENARMYFDRAIDGHRRAVSALTTQNVQALHITSLLVSFYALFSLSENDTASSLSDSDYLLWMRLADGVKILSSKWQEIAGENWMLYTAVFFGKPNMLDEEELFRKEHADPFRELLTWARDFENVTEEDQICYEQALSYIGLAYKSVLDHSDHPLASCRRLMALPSRLPRRFTELVEVRSPRAMVMLAHAFAIMKLVSHEVPWLQGVAERQVPKIYHQIPAGWRDMMKWPMMIAEDKVEPNDIRADDKKDVPTTMAEEQPPNNNLQKA